jgi:hypothetical protein
MEHMNTTRKWLHFIMKHVKIYIYINFYPTRVGI